MHAMFFGAKRANQVSQNFLNAKLREFGITAARFDLMYVMRHDRWQIGTMVRELRYRLGVCKEVLYRMLKSLRDEGFVRREPKNKRHFVWLLTRLGRRVFRRAVRYVWPDVRREVLRVFSPYGQLTTLEQFMNTEGALLVFQDGFGDTSRLLYSYGHPDD